MGSQLSSGLGIHDLTWQPLRYVSSMRVFNVALVHHGVAHCGVDFLMPQEHLHLLYGHASVDCACCDRAAELVGMDRHAWIVRKLAIVKCHWNMIVPQANDVISLQQDLRAGICA